MTTTNPRRRKTTRSQDIATKIAVLECEGPIIKKEVSPEVRKKRSEHLKKIRAARRDLPAGTPRKATFESIIRKKRTLQNFIEQDFKDLPGAAIKAGFAESTAKGNMSVITSSKSWAAIVDELLPDDLIARRHLELLNKRDIERYTEYEIGADGKRVAVAKWRDNGPETAAVSKALDMAYKLKNSYKDTSGEAPNTSVYNLIYKPEIRANLKSFEDQLKLAMYAENNKEVVNEARKVITIPTAERYVDENEKPFTGDEDDNDGNGEGGAE